MSTRGLFLGALVAALAVCAATGTGCGTGSPWTKLLRVVVVHNTADGSGVVPVPNALVTVARATTGGGGASTGGSQSLAVDSNGLAIFRVDPGYSYTITATATGYQQAQLVVDIGFFADTEITRRLTLAPSA